MSKNNHPDYLYHYTSIEILALILKNHTIRLRPLHTMDDKQEQRSSDMKNIGKHFFISSWTSDTEESIPMWNLYTPLSSGVRIGLKKNPFKHYPVPKRISAEATDESTTFINGELLNKGILSPNMRNMNLLKEVVYTDDISQLEPNVIKNNSLHSFDFGEFGYIKNSYWRFQKEWRYVASFFNFSVYNKSLSDMKAEWDFEFHKIKNGTNTPPFSEYDLEIEDEYFKTMVITPSPKISDGNMILLNALVDRYNPTAIIEESTLKNLI